MKITKIVVVLDDPKEVDQTQTEMTEKKNLVAKSWKKNVLERSLKKVEHVGPMVEVHYCVNQNPTT